jgi:hypothetical protein
MDKLIRKRDSLKVVKDDLDKVKTDFEKLINDKTLPADTVKVLTAYRDAVVAYETAQTDAWSAFDVFVTKNDAFFRSADRFFVEVDNVVDKNDAFMRTYMLEGGRLK